MPRRFLLLFAALAAVAGAQQPAWTIIGWRVVVHSASFRQATLFESIDKTAAAGAKMMEGDAAQKVSAEIPKAFDWNLSETEVAAVRRKLRSAGLTMPAYSTRGFPQDEAGLRKLFGFAKSLGADIIIGEPPPEQWAFIERFTGEFGINVALLGPASQMQALEGRSQRMGICADMSAWVNGNMVKDRLLGLRVRDAGAAKTAELLRQTYRLNPKPLLLTLESTEVAALDKVVTSVVGIHLDEVSRTDPVRRNITAEERQKIEAAVPRQAVVKPKKPKKLLIFGLNAAYGGHRSIPHANVALELMAKQTGAFEAVFSNDLANLRHGKLRQFGAIYLNNTVGPVFCSDEVREGLSRYVREGGGLAGHHGTGRASTDWPEIGKMLGAVAGPHAIASEKVTVKVDDPASPINAAFGGQGFEITDEFFRPAGPYSRETLHVLLSFDVPKTDMTQSAACAACARPDNDYAISWIHNYGQGRVFYSAFGHAPADFWNPRLLQHFLAGIQFALGDLPADTTPSAKFKVRK